MHHSPWLTLSVRDTGKEAGRFVRFQLYFMFLFVHLGYVCSFSLAYIGARSPPCQKHPPNGLTAIYYLSFRNYRHVRYTEWQAVTDVLVEARCSAIAKAGWCFNFRVLQSPSAAKTWVWWEVVSQTSKNYPTRTALLFYSSHSSWKRSQQPWSWSSRLSRPAYVPTCTS